MKILLLLFFVFLNQMPLIASGNHGPRLSEKALDYVEDRLSWEEKNAFPQHLIERYQEECDRDSLGSSESDDPFSFRSKSTHSFRGRRIPSGIALRFTSADEEEDRDLLGLTSSSVDMLPLVSQLRINKELELINTLKELRKRIFHNVSQQISAYEVGAVEALLDLLATNEEISVLIEVHKTLACLAFCNPEIQAKIQRNNGINYLKEQAAKAKNPQLLESISWALFNVVNTSKATAERVLTSDLLDIKILKAFFQCNSVDTQRRITCFIMNISTFKSIRIKLGEIGVIPFIVMLTLSKNREVHRYSRQALKNLCPVFSKNRKRMKRAKSRLLKKVSCGCCGC